MKKLLIVLLLCFMLTGCSKDPIPCTCAPPPLPHKPTLTAVELTLDNYNDYLIVDKLIRGKPNHIYVGVELEFRNGFYPARETWVTLDSSGYAETEYDTVINIKGFIIILGE